MTTRHTYYYECNNPNNRYILTQITVLVIYASVRTRSYCWAAAARP